MQIGEIIRKYRKEKNMTQEEMANRLGVTAPAVNKWENGNTMPDILLLSPIARLLGISLDTLLSFREELTKEEISNLVQEMDNRLGKDKEDFAAAFQWAKEQMETYPNSEELILSLAVILHARLLFLEIPDAEGYEAYIEKCYVRALESKEEAIRYRAADSLFSFFVQKQQYELAEKYLDYFSRENPERKRKQALIYSQTGRTEEAWKAYEEMLFSDYQMLSIVFQSLIQLALKEDDRERAHKLVDKLHQLARVFEMGAYQEVSFGLELATLEQDADAVIGIMSKMLDSLSQDGMTGFTKSDLYRHMGFREMREEFAAKIRDNLLNCFRDEETFGWLREDARWQELVRD